MIFILKEIVRIVFWFLNLGGVGKPCLFLLDGVGSSVENIPDGEVSVTVYVEMVLYICHLSL